MERFAVTPCNDYHEMSWGGSENDRWLQLDISISMLRSSSGESIVYYRNTNGRMLCCAFYCQKHFITKCIGNHINQWKKLQFATHQKL